MTGRQYTFKKLGHAFAVIGYIMKWYSIYHDKNLCLENAEGCSVCKWMNHFNAQSRS